MKHKRRPVVPLPDITHCPKLIPVVCLLIFFCSSPCWARDGVQEIEEVVVTATRGEKSIDEVTADVGVISEAEIKTAPANNVDDILRQLGGVDIRRPSDFGITSPLGINIRGVGGTKRVLFQVDGVPINSSLTGFVYPNQVQTGAVERMEVVKGPFSSLYGSNAMGGVINVLTKDRDEEGVDVTPYAKLGAFDQVEAGTGILGRSGKLAYTLNAGHRQIDNHYRRDTDVDYTYNFMTGEFTKGTVDVSDHSEYDDNRFFAKLAYDVSDRTRLTFSGNFARTDSEMGYTKYQPQQLEKDTEHTFYFLNLGAATTVGNDIDLEMRVYTNYDASDGTTEHILSNSSSSGSTGSGGMGSGSGTMNSMGSSSMGSGSGSSSGSSMGGSFGGMGMGGSSYSYIYGTRESWGRDVGLQLKAGKALGDMHYLTMGIDANFLKGIWENKELDGAFIGDKMDETINNQALYLQNESVLHQDLIMTLGVRYDINSESENALSPKLGFLYRFNDRISFRSSVGRAYRAPNLNELYTPTWMMVPGIPFESNPDLDPEYIWSVDLGTTVKLSDHLDFYLTGFYSKAEDLISNPISNGVMRYENLDEVETDGFETGLGGNLLPWLRFDINYTYTHSVDKGTGQRLDDMPLHQANGGLIASRVLTPDITLSGSIYLRYNGEMGYTDNMSGTSIDLDSWLVGDIGLRLDLFGRFGIQAALTNFTDENYEIHGSNLGPERCYWVAMDYKF